MVHEGRAIAHWSLGFCCVLWEPEKTERRKGDDGGGKRGVYSFLIGIARFLGDDVIRLVNGANS